MKELIIAKNDSGQRLDKYLGKYLRNAPSSFIYKMLRKKNIVLNQKKADGKEIISEGDIIKLFLSDDTIDKFSANNIVRKSYHRLMPRICYEDSNLIIADKPVGMLSQQDEADSISFNEIAIDYLLNKNEINEESLKSFKPSVVNRLDRNTSGLILFAKNYATAKFLSEILRDRSLHKYYRCIVSGNITKPMLLDGSLEKDEAINKVYINKNSEEGSKIYTQISPVRHSGENTELEILLITGKTHQIRAHLASISHPLIGDYKYGNRRENDYFKKRFGVGSQLLCAYRLQFPTLAGDYSYLSEKSFEIDRPEVFERIMTDGNLEIQRS